mmetsp:Transcript_8274/g.12665  ORF Transcript_8274/g.12665 Transcript_8274/m.12665 type:complete len:275 (-) Transcript_8274:174-998(-)
MLHTFSCLTSCYFYAFIAAFGLPSRGEFLNTAYVAYESIFTISIVLNFFVEYQPDGSSFPVRDLFLVAKKYFRGTFIWDLVPLLPLQMLDLNGYERLFFIIKIMRLVIGFRIFSVPKIMALIKGFYKQRMEQLIETNPQIAEDTIMDQNNISLLIKINNAMKIMLLVMIILNTSYFLGFFWYIVSDLNVKAVEYFEIVNPNSEYFYEVYLLGNDDWTNAIKVVYYAFTSLSTVGFGDYYPKSDMERLLAAVTLLFGVAIFSYMMGIFIEILGKV